MGVQRLLTPAALLAALALVVGCQPPVTPPGPAGGSPSPGSSAAPTAAPAATTTPAAGGGATTAPSGTPGPVGSPSAAPSASVAPSATPTPVAAYETGILRGTVYDGTAAKVPDGTVVTVTSLDTSRPYNVTTATAAGAYVVNQVPIDTQLQVTATRPGWTRRSRVVVVRKHDPRLTDRNIFDFGGAGVASTDKAGRSYYISPYPEIEKVEPTDQDTSLPNDKMSFKITMSEKLDVVNQRRLSAAFLIIPNNSEALGPDTSLPAEPAGAAELTGLRIGDAAAPELRYSYRQNSGFLNGFETSEFKWDSEGRTATFTLDAPVKTDVDDEAEYAFLLIQRDDDPIRDAENLPLGMDELNEFGATRRNDIIYNAVAEPSLSLSEGTAFDEEKERWADTHLSWTSFQVVADQTKPKLVSVVARRDYLDTDGTSVDRIELTFSEPMIAYPQIASKGLLSLNNYVFGAADTEDATKALVVTNNGTAEDVAVTATATDVRDRFRDAGSVVIAGNQSQQGNFSVAMSVKDPRVVIFEMPAGSFPLSANFIKVFVGSDVEAGGSAGDEVADAAGNRVDTAANSAVGPIY